MMLIVIDGNNWYSRAWFALKPTTSTEPEIIQADMEERCVRSVQTVLDWIEDTKLQLKPSELVICWDSPNSVRKELSPEYKANREKPEGYRAAMAVLRRNLEDQWQVEIDGNEADDLLAKFAIDARKTGQKCLLCSTDKDLHQCLVKDCVSQCTSIERPFADRKIKFNVLTAESLHKKYGVTASQWIDYRCMVGDKTDGLAGVPGIGPVNAKDVLVACGSLDEFYADPFKAPITDKKREALLAFKPQLPLVRQLITLPLRKPA